MPGKTKGTRILRLQTCTAQASSLALTSGLILSGFHFPPESYSKQEALPIHTGSGEIYGLSATQSNAARPPNFIDRSLGRGEGGRYIAAIWYASPALAPAPEPDALHRVLTLWEASTEDIILALQKNKLHIIQACTDRDDGAR